MHRELRMTSTERAQRVGTAEAPGYVALYIHNGSHGASEALLAAVQQIVDGYRDGASDTWVGGYRPAGMRVQVLAMADLAFDVDLELTATIGAVTATVEAAVSGALGRWLRARVPGDRVRPIDLVNAALGVDGVSAATILAPTTTITVAPSSIAYLRAATVTWTA